MRTGMILAMVVGAVVGSTGAFAQASGGQTFAERQQANRAAIDQKRATKRQDYNASQQERHEASAKAFASRQEANRNAVAQARQERKAAYATASQQRHQASTAAFQQRQQANRAEVASKREAREDARK